MSYQQSPLTKPTDHQSVFALNELIIATRALADQIHEATTSLHGDLQVTRPERSVLLKLRRGGAQTVPALARRGAVSRQFIQTVVNGLLGRDLAVASTNPAHQRSKLIELTPAGTVLIREVLHREGSVLAGLAGDLSAQKIRQAAAVLQQVRENLSEHPASLAGAVL